MMQLEGFHLEKAENVKVPIHLNMAACQLRIDDPTTAIYNCSQVTVTPVLLEGPVDLVWM
jgi:hypothetical protein